MRDINTINRLLAAGRQLGGLAQKELAELMGATQQRISAIDSGKVDPKHSEIEAYKKVLRLQGVLITETGVALSQTTTVTELEREDFFYDLQKDMLATLEGKVNAELLFDGSDDRASPPHVNAMFRRMRNAGIKMRQLVEEGNTYLMGELEEYRYIPKEFFINEIVSVYGDKVVIHTQKGATVIQDRMVAQVFRNNFNRFWSVSQKPKESTADERF